MRKIRNFIGLIDRHISDRRLTPSQVRRWNERRALINYHINLDVITQRKQRPAMIRCIIDWSDRMNEETNEMNDKTIVMNDKTITNDNHKFDSWEEVAVYALDEYLNTIDNRPAYFKNHAFGEIWDDLTTWMEISGWPVENRMFEFHLALRTFSTMAPIVLLGVTA